MALSLTEVIRPTVFECGRMLMKNTTERLEVEEKFKVLQVLKESGCEQIAAVSFYADRNSASPRPSERELRAGSLFHTQFAHFKAEHVG
jgi:hypothetical protein